MSFDAFPSPKGAAVHIGAFARALGEAFGDVQLVTIAAAEQGASADEAPESAAMPWAQLPAGRAIGSGVVHTGLVPSGANIISRALHFRALLRRWWGERRAGIVHFRGIFEGYPIARRKSQLCDKLVYEVNGLPSIELKYHYPAVVDDDELVAKLVQQEQFCIDAADLLITPSPVTAAELVRRGALASRIVVIPNGVDETLFGYRAPVSSLDGVFRLLYVGTLTSWQGLTHAIDAVARVRREGHDVRFTVVGPGRKRQRFALLELAQSLGIAEHLEIVPPVSQAELIAYYHRSDAALVPLAANDRNLVQGCCPLKLIEAMASGVPVVASDLPVVRALAEDGEVLFAKPGSSRSLASALEQLIAEPRLGAQLARAARLRVERSLTWRGSCEQLVACYREQLLGSAC